MTCKSIGCQNTVEGDSDFCNECLLTVPSDSEDSGTSLAQALSRASSYAAAADPNGKDQHQPGAKLDHGKPRMSLITGGMARALVAVSEIATFGARKYTDGGWVSVPNGFQRYEDAQQRHAALRHQGEEVDTESGYLHLAHEAWNALAKLDLYLRAKEPDRNCCNNCVKL